MVWDEVDDHFQTGAVGALHEIFKLAHTLVGLRGQVGVDVVVVLDGIGRAGGAFHHFGVVAAYAVGAVVRLCGVFQEACVPDVGEAKLSDAVQGGSGKVFHLAASVFLYGAAGLVGGILVAIQAGQHLVNKYAFGHVSRGVNTQLV